MGGRVIGVQTLLNISKGLTGIFFFQNDQQLSSCSLTMKLALGVASHKT